MDIIFGEYVSLKVHIYAFLLVDVATRYCLLYGMSYLSSASITSALEAFKSESVKLPHLFQSEFDKNLINGKALQWIMANNSNIIAAPDGRQSSIVLAERTWCNLIQMSRAYITEDLVQPKTYTFSTRALI